MDSNIPQHEQGQTQEPGFISIKVQNHGPDQGINDADGPTNAGDKGAWDDEADKAGSPSQ